MPTVHYNTFKGYQQNIVVPLQREAMQGWLTAVNKASSEEVSSWGVG